jgi:uncharacterized iron-regulated membrane protein
MRLRGIWLSIHKWIGILLAILIIPISVTGSALVWHDWLDEQINPQRYAVSTNETRLTPSQYAAAAQPTVAQAAQGGQVAQIRYPEGGEGPVMVAGTRPQPGEGRPPRTNVWLDPGTGAVLDSASSQAGLVQVFHVLHGSMMVPVWGRTIVGWVGVFMFLSCLTGLWLWWPVTGSLKRGFRWKRQNSTNANLHHQLGFWIAIPLAMLSFTGFWISFPSVFSTFEAGQPKGGEGRGKGKQEAPPDRARAMRAQPLARTALTPEAALAAATPASGGRRLVSITWPTDQSSEWKIAYEREGGPAEISVDDATGAVTPARPPRPETNARLMRRLHDGTGMGTFWQIIIFIGGIIPAILAITGLVMWWRSRGWRKMLAKTRKAKALGAAAPQPAE